MYSAVLDGAFHLHCAQFNDSVRNELEGKFVTTPFKAWQNKTKKCKKNHSVHYHSARMELAD